MAVLCAAAMYLCTTPEVHMLFRASHQTSILAVAEPAHPVAALNVAACIYGVLGLNPMLGVHLQQTVDQACSHSERR
jgi:hypothetical protein